MGESLYPTVNRIPFPAAVTVGGIPYQRSTSPTRSLLFSHVPLTSEIAIGRDFGVFGNVRSVQMESLPYGIVIVHFYDIRHAETAFTFIRNISCFSHPPDFVAGGQPLSVYFVLPFEEDNQGTIAVYNLPTDVSAYDLRQAFKPFGQITEVRESPLIKNLRFIEFFDTRAAALALKNMSGKKIYGKQVVMEFSTKPTSNDIRFYTRPIPQFYAHIPCQTSLSLSSVLPDDLIEEVLSYIPVRYLLPMRCVCKSWKIIISSPTFCKLHLNRSATRNPPQITLADLVLTFTKDTTFKDDNISITYSHCRNPLKLENTTKFPHFIGSYNGLLCKVHCVTSQGLIYINLWNSATLTSSTNLTSFTFGDWQNKSYHPWKFAFGGHGNNNNNSTHTYKFVAFHQESNQVKVFNFSSKVWRNIESFPEVPLYDSKFHISSFHFINDGVNVKDTLNWLIYPPLLKYNLIDQFVIISLDLRTETYRQFFLPPSFDKVISKPTLSSLNDYICFCHDVNGTHFEIWKMTADYGGGLQAWHQIFHISYNTLPIHNGPLDFSRLALFPLWISRNGNKLLLTWNEDSQAIFYNLRKNRVDLKCKINNVLQWVYFLECVESSAFTH